MFKIVIQTQTKELKKFLAERGLSCNGCAEKDDFVKMAFENQDTPIVPKEPEPEPAPSSGDKDANIEEVTNFAVEMSMSSS